jgi:hypothetical protein
VGRQDLAAYHASSRVDRRTPKVGVFAVAARRFIPYAATYAAFRRFAERWRY